MGHGLKIGARTDTTECGKGSFGLRMGYGVRWMGSTRQPARVPATLAKRGIGGIRLTIPPMCV